MTVKCLTTFVFLLAVACTPLAKQNSMEFIPATNELAGFFSGYNSTTGKFVEVCVGSTDPVLQAVDTIMKPEELTHFERKLPDGSVTIEDGVSVRNLLALLNGNNRASLNLVGLSGSGSLDYAIKAAQTEYNRSFTIHAAIHQDLTLKRNGF